MVITLKNKIECSFCGRQLCSSVRFINGVCELCRRQKLEIKESVNKVVPNHLPDTKRRIEAIMIESLSLSMRFYYRKKIKRDRK